MEGLFNNNENVNHPEHYQGKNECIDVMIAMFGIEAVKQIKAVNPGAKVIMCSAMGQQSMVMDAIKAGASDFIVKPFQADRVLEAVKKIVG